MMYSKKLLFIFLLLFSSAAYCQQGYEKFYNDFNTVMRYKREFRDSCLNTYANLLIDIDSTGKIADVKLSDSAPKQFKKLFELSKSKLKTDLLADFIKQKELKSCGILIPVFYVFSDSYCQNSFEGKSLENRYLNFNAEPYKKMVLALPPIVNMIYEPRQ